MQYIFNEKDPQIALEHVSGLAKKTHSDAITPDAGVVAVIDALKNPETEFEFRLSEYLNPDIDMDVKNQIQLLTEFWGALGYELPALNDDQLVTIGTKLEEYPHRRLMSAPLLDLRGRKVIVEKAKAVFPKSLMGNTDSELWTPISTDEECADKYGILLAETGATHEKYGIKYVMRYRTPNRDYAVGRADYIKDLETAGQVVKGKDNTQWTWSLIDVAVNSPRVDKTVGKLHRMLSPTATPEAHIAIKILHLANGTPSAVNELDIVNEAVYALGPRKFHESDFVPVSVACVSYGGGGNNDINLYSWFIGNDPKTKSFCVRAEESAI